MCGMTGRWCLAPAETSRGGNYIPGPREGVRTAGGIRVHLAFPLLVPIGAVFRSQRQWNTEQACSRHHPCPQCSAGVTPLNSSARTCRSAAGLPSAQPQTNAWGRRDVVQSIPLGLCPQNPSSNAERRKMPTW